MKSINRSGSPYADDARDLIVMHCLTASNLLHADKMGGIAVPSLAVTKVSNPLTKFGEISLIGTKAMADPKGYAQTKVFGGDIYSPRYPSVERDLDKKNLAVLAKRLRSMADRMNTDLPSADQLQRDGQSAMEKNLAVMGQFLREHDIEPAIIFTAGMSPDRESRLREFGLGQFLNNTDAWDLQQNKAFFDGALSEIIDNFKKIKNEHSVSLIKSIKDNEAQQRNMVRGVAQEVAISARVRQNPEVDSYATRLAIDKQITDAGLRVRFSEYVANILDSITKSERIFLGFTYSGNRRYISHTLENVVRLLKQELRGGENFNYGVGSLRAQFTPQFRSIAQIRQHKDKLIVDAQFEKLKDEINDEFFLVANKISKDLSIDTASAILEDAAKKGLRAAAKEYGYDLSREAEAAVSLFLNKLRNLPTAYFEAKILRAVSLSEFCAAVVPENVNPKATEVLQSAGVRTIRTYPRGNEDAYRQAIADACEANSDKVLFSRGYCAGSLPEDAVRQMADAISSRWAQSPPIVVVENMQDLRVPPSVREKDGNERSAGAVGKPRGFYHHGTVYLVANGLNNASDVAEVLFHEALGHYGLRSVFGPGLDGILDQVADACPRAMKEKAKDYGKDLAVPTQRREVAEEVLAEMAQTRPEIGFVRRAAASIRTWLRKNVPALNSMPLTETEIRNNYILPARHWVERGMQSDAERQNDALHPEPRRPMASALESAFDRQTYDSLETASELDGESAPDIDTFCEEDGDFSPVPK